MKSIIRDTPKKININDKKITQVELYNFINKASAHKDSLVKLYKEKEEEYTVSFLWDDRNKWKIDYPIELSKIHKQRYVTHKQCLNLSEHIFKGKPLDSLKGFIDVPVKYFTLDEMLEFKREDQMMLQGKDPDLNKPKATPVKKATPIKNKVASKKRDSLRPTKEIKQETSPKKKAPIETSSLWKTTNLREIVAEDTKSKKSTNKTSHLKKKPLAKKEVTIPEKPKEAKQKVPVKKEAKVKSKPVVKKTTPKVAPIRKSKPKTTQVMGERIGDTPKKEVKKTKKDGSKDDTGFFQI